MFGLFRALAACAAFTMLAACAGAPTQPALTPLGQVRGSGIQSARERVPQDGSTGVNIFGREQYVAFGQEIVGRSFFSREAVGKPLIFISVQGSKGHVDIYRQSSNPKLVGQIAGLLPEGLATDNVGNLYIANGLGSKNTSVLVYKPPYTGTPAVLADPAGSPLGVAVSGSGVVAAANDNGTVNFYAKNSTTACVTVANSAQVAQVASATFGDDGILYVVAFDPNFNPVLGEIVGGCNAKTITLLTTANTLSFPFSVEATRNDRIAVLDTSTSIIYVYNAPKMGSLGPPVSQTQLSGSSQFAFAFLPSNHDVYALQYGGIAEQFDYPAGGTPEKTITIPGAGKAPAGGVAVFPRPIP